MNKATAWAFHEFNKLLPYWRGVTKEEAIEAYLKDHPEGLPPL